MRTRISTTIGLGLVLAGCHAPYGKGRARRRAACQFGLRGLRPARRYDDLRHLRRLPGISRPSLCQSQSVPPYRLDQYNNRVDAEGYRVDGTGHRMPVDSLDIIVLRAGLFSQEVLRDGCVRN